jgi:hypothetical protein
VAFQILSGKGSKLPVKLRFTVHPSIKIHNLAFEFLFQFESNSNSASTIIQRINSSTAFLSIGFEVYMQNLVQFTHKQGHIAWTGPRMRSARRHAHTRDATRRRRRAPQYYGRSAVEVCA